MRWALPLLLAGALVAPAGAAAFPDAAFENACRYSYDSYWRPIPIVFGGKLTDGAGVELASGTRLQVGDVVRLQDGTVSAELPSWILPFAVDGQMIPAGDSELPVRAWLSLEATNTAEGETAPIALDTVARAHVELDANGTVDEQRSTLTVVGAPIPLQTWTATGGEVQVRQAAGDALPVLPVGVNGAALRPYGSLYVEASLALGAKLQLDCLQGQASTLGTGFVDAQPGPLGTFPVAGWDGAVDGAPLAEPVDADLLTSAGPPRAGLGERATVGSTTLRLRLTDAQRAAWLGSATSATVTATVALHGERSAEQVQSLPISRAVTVPASGAATVTLPVPDSTWTAATADGIDLRGERSLTLVAAAGGQSRTLALTRVTAGDPYPFARVLRTAVRPPAPPIETPTPVPTPVATPVPTATPTPAAVVRVRSAKLKVAKKTRVPVSLACAAGPACSGTLSLRTASKVKVGKKKAKRLVTLARSARYRVAAGRTATVRLTLSKDAKTLLKSRRSLRVRLTLKPASGKAVAKTLTLAR